ncbi:zinc-dependent metalloprotease [Fimbriimonas ginsengisoli]|uniref:DUF5117 domain-containing protein n=1 Tax=Fimbriimonas ginsengisoli Gsoil 348 TaxID=661478 RepID=A0A068NWA9_FIMGI|nr:zinc-dependent metalloprotease [Fimbriimonas ginsengisoli]AIE87818.1 hypothetical protein OP10G_4450 [Fimbriimonas ginsengisoli Gsoil 348]
MTRTLPVVALALAFGLGFPTAVQAQAAKEEPKKEEAQKDPKVAAYDAAIKDLKRIEGSVVLYQRNKELLLELPEDKLGKLFLVQVALSTGLDAGLMSAGMPVGDTPVDSFKWVRNEGQVWLERPNIANRWDPKDDLSVGAQRTFPEAILGSFRIEQENPQKKLLLVNVTQLFFGDTFHLSEMVMSGLNGPYMLERDKSGVEAVHGYPENTVVQMKLHYASPRGSQGNLLMMLLGLGGESTLEDDRSAPVRVTYDLWYRKDDGYVPRLADPRIGYFTQDFFSIDRFLNEDRRERYINRFHLEKKDPKAKLSEPVKPIVWTIDPSIPEAYRPAIKEGILRWNKAYEDLGYKNAIQVQDVPKDDKNYDHADGRYNVVRMLIGPGAPFAAISLPRTDPITGEILNASITLDGNVIRDLQVEHQRNQASFGTARQKALNVMLRDPQRTETDDYYLFATPEQRAWKQAQATMKKYGWTDHACDYASELGIDAGLDWYAIASVAGPLNKEEYVKRFLADCVSHELGHCLGLRHNFAGSTNLTTAQLADDTLTSKTGLTASVMDYTPPNVQAVLRGKGNFYTTSIGSYDEWAIRYGYSDFGAKTPTGEKYQLARIASESSLPGHAYKTDEDADNWDPYAVRFDLGKDPLVYSDRVLLSLARARDYAIHNLPKPGESYSKRTAIIVNSLLRSFREGRNAARFVGGVVANKNFKGDAGEQPTLAPVTPQIQRQAVSLVTKHFFAPDAFDLPPSVLSSLSQDENSGAWTAPLRDIIGSFQANLLAMLIGASATDKITENSYKNNGYTLDQHYGTIISAIFSEVGQNQNIKPLRRDLQRFAISGLIQQTGAPQGSVNEDVRMITGDMLRRLDKRFVAQLAKPAKLDSMTRIHLRDSHETISRFLNRTAVTSR